MVAINEDSTPQEVLQVITEEGFSRIPVYSETVDHIIGVVHSRDILQAALLNKNFELKKLMTEPMYVHRSMKIARLLSEFQRKKIHIAIVMDDYGGTLGIVTMEDVLEELNRDYVTGARARGVREGVILRGSVLRCAMLTILTLLALSVGSLLGGTAIIESIFQWDGVGKLAVDAITMRDYPMIQAYVVWMAVIYVAVNLVTDLLYHALDPRIRLGVSR